MAAHQLNLALSLPDDALFSNFLAPSGSARLQVLGSLKNALARDDSFANILIWGATGSGLTHLLQATRHEAANKKLSQQYLSLHELVTFPANDVLQGLESYQIICLDNIQAVMGLPEWEEALFHLFNKLMDAQALLLMTADAPPRSLKTQLPDLKSRLSAGTIFQLPAYNDAEKAAIVQSHANKIGLYFSEEALGFLMNRAPRDLHSLLDHLQLLDSYALQCQSKPTIPLMKKAFGW